MTDSVLWTGNALLKALEGKLIAGVLSGANGISIDSRDIQPNDAFFAIKGDMFDGHDYTEKAVQNGASVVVISGKNCAPNGNNTAVILVDNVLHALEKLAVAARARSKAKIIAITGSVGKTSVKEYLHQCLAQCGKTHASVKSFNNHWGVPISLARMPQDAEFGVFEIGMNHLDEIRPLVKMVRPHFALITTIAPAHLGHFKNLNEIALAKSEIFEGLEKNGVAILNHDNEFFDYLKQKADGKDIQSFGKHKNADLRLLNAETLPDKSKVKIAYKGTEYNYIMGKAGLHQVQNSLALLLALSLMDVDLEHILPLLETMSLSDGRGGQEKIAFKDGHILLIDESYNANPASMVAAFSVLSAQQPQNGGRKIAIIGDMLELGVTSAKLHKALVDDIIAANIDMVFACGADMKNCYDALPLKKQGEYAQNSSQLVQSILNRINPYDVVMVKGSLGSKMLKIVNAIKNNKVGN